MAVATKDAKSCRPVKRKPSPARKGKGKVKPKGKGPAGNVPKGKPGKKLTPAQARKAAAAAAKAKRIADRKKAASKRPAPKGTHTAKTKAKGAAAHKPCK